jgi:hypothetical protein
LHPHHLSTHARTLAALSWMGRQSRTRPFLPAAGNPRYRRVAATEGLVLGASSAGNQPDRQSASHRIPRGASPHAAQG